MKAQKLSATGAAQKPFIGLRPAAGMSFPGGEETGLPTVALAKVGEGEPGSDLLHRSEEPGVRLACPVEARQKRALRASASYTGVLSLPIRVSFLAKNGDSGLIQTNSGQKTTHRLCNSKSGTRSLCGKAKPEGSPNFPSPVALSQGFFTGKKRLFIFLSPLPRTVPPSSLQGRLRLTSLCCVLLCPIAQF